MKSAPGSKALNEELQNANKIAAIITDLDNTLWQGILCETEQQSLNEKYYRFLVGLYKTGVQLFVVSKNDQADVDKAFKELKVDSALFTAVIANWDAKYLNIEKLLQYTELRPETIVFIDDGILERNEVKAKIPKIHCLAAEDWSSLMDVPAIKKRNTQSTTEVLERMNRYKTAISAKQQKTKFVNDIEFYRSLQRELAIGLVSADNLDRFTRLLVETHRINFNPGKFAVYEEALDYLYELLNKGCKLFAISTRENNISLGLTGALVVKIQGDQAQIIDGTFSCGIIGRDFEQKSILTLIGILKKQNVNTLQAFVTLTSTNQRVRQVFQDLGFSEDRQAGEKAMFSLALAGYQPKVEYDWITILSTAPELDYTGHPAVISAFEALVKPLVKTGFCILNLGSARGEVLGHLQQEVRARFYAWLDENKVKYTKVDKQFYPEEQNLVADAEDLSQVIKDESQELVMAVELLEHTQHFWKVINEAIRVCKVNGYIFLSVPSFNFPKHEYPIDLWRIGPKTLASFFPSPNFEIISLQTEGKKELPRRTIILVRKVQPFKERYDMPRSGKTDWQTGLTVFP